MNVCGFCREPIEQPVTGRPRKWCGDRCRRLGASERVPIDIGDTDPISPAAAELLSFLKFTPDDPRGVAGLLLRQLTAALDADPGNIALAREVRQLLMYLSGTADSMVPGEVDTARVRFLLSRIETFPKRRGEMAGARGPSRFAEDAL